MVNFLLASEVEMYQDHESGACVKRHREGDWVWRVHHAFNAAFERCGSGITGAGLGAWITRAFTHGLLWLFIALSCLLVPFLGQDFFPQVDAGQFRLHVRAPAGTRIEETERHLRPGGGDDPGG